MRHTFESVEGAAKLPQGHEGTIHEDEILGEWNEEGMITSYPYRNE
ncbi:hypothetical protein ACFWMG_04505 [Streptomyces sp. NPDC127074]